MYHLKAHIKGFTLIELLLIIIVISIIAVFALPNFLETTNKAKDTSTISSMRVVQLAAELFAANNSSVYPTDLTTTDEKGNNIITYFPGGQLLENTYTKNNTEPRIGALADDGQISYSPIIQSGKSVGYTINALGSNGSSLPAITNN